jgi:DNA polymerase-3 subunit alpha
MNFISNFSKYSIENYGYIRLPEIHITKEQKTELNLPENVSNLDFCKALCRQGWKERCNHVKKEDYPKYKQRIEYELEILDELGFVDYLLLVWMVINKARELGVFIDYGRGSIGGCCVAWLLKITGFPVDPIRHGLFFERFVSRARNGKKIIDGKLFLKGDLLADADLNLGNGRESIVSWLKEVYPNCISKISNISSFTTKILIKDVYKSLEEVDEFEAHRVSDMIEMKYGVVQSIEETYKENKEFKEWADNHSETVKVCKSLCEIMRSTSSHASGYLVSFYELTDLIPLEINKEGDIVSSYDMRIVSNFATKLDLLSLTTNAIIKRVADIIPEKVDDINLDDDPFIYNKFQDSKLLPYGLYQISADCAYGVTESIKPKNINELSDINALARPGSLSYVGTYKNNNGKPVHEVFNSILATTRFVPLYQEQLMQMSVAVGFTKDESEIIRKIVGKKDLQKVKEWEQKIYDKCQANGFEKIVADSLWKLLNDSASYSFNKAHSASTAYLSALTVYLKYKYPVQWYWSCLIGTKELAAPLEEITAIQKELQHFNIKLLAPDIIKSGFEYTIEDGNIRTGISSLRNLSTANLEKLKSFKATATNKFELFMSCQNAKLPLGVISSIILSGTFDSFNSNSRNRLLLEFEIFNELTPRELPIINSLGPKYNYDLPLIIKLASTELKNEKGKLHISEKRILTLRRDTADFFAKFHRNEKFSALTIYLAENYYLGFSYSHSLKSIYSKHINNLHDLKSIKTLPPSPPRESYLSVVQIGEVEKRVSKNKKDYVKYTLKDDTDSLTVMDFQLDSRGGKMFKESMVCVFHLTKKKLDSGDILYFVSDIIEQEVPTVLKVSTIRKELEEKENKE